MSLTLYKIYFTQLERFTQDEESASPFPGDGTKETTSSSYDDSSVFELPHSTFDDDSTCDTHTTTSHTDLSSNRSALSKRPTLRELLVSDIVIYLFLRPFICIS